MCAMCAKLFCWHACGECASPEFTERKITACAGQITEPASDILLLRELCDIEQLRRSAIDAIRQLERH